ncbi:MAG: glycyl-radical enzyme activating protein [Aminobacteriaceae bacterium]
MDFGKEPSGCIFDVKRYSIHDGPGIRTTFFFKGCPLSCWWCHNPEGISPLPAPSYHPNRCIGCGRCVRECPMGARSLVAEGVVLDSSKCVECRKCEQVCPTRAIEFVGTEMTVEDVLRLSKRDIPFYDESGGGVTFSGGEPLLQPEFLVSCLKALHAEEIHTAVDTSGYCREEDLLLAAETADIFLFDLKMIDQELHKHYTGVNNHRILANLRSLDDRLHERGRGKINVRIPLIPGVNDSDAEIMAMIDCVLELKSVTGVNILPYHSIGSGKYKNLSMEYRMEGTKPPSEEEVGRVLSMFEMRGIIAVKGG